METARAARGARRDDTCARTRRMQAARNKVDDDNGRNERIRVISGGSESPHARRRFALPTECRTFRTRGAVKRASRRRRVSRFGFHTTYPEAGVSVEFRIVRNTSRAVHMRTCHTYARTPSHCFARHIHHQKFSSPSIHVSFARGRRNTKSSPRGRLYGIQFFPENASALKSRVYKCRSLKLTDRTTFAPTPA